MTDDEFQCVQTHVRAFLAAETPDDTRRVLEAVPERLFEVVYRLCANWIETEKRLLLE